MIKRFYFTLTILILAGFERLSACAACYGDPSSSAGKGMDMAIITLLGVIGPVLIAIAVGIISIGLKSKKLNQNLDK